MKLIVSTNTKQKQRDSAPSTFARFGIPLPSKSSAQLFIPSKSSARLVFDLVDFSVNFDSDDVVEVHHVGLYLVFDLCTALGDNL